MILASWGSLGRPLRPLGASWRPLGPSWGHLGRLGAILGLPVRQFWRSLGLSGTFWRLPGGYRGLCQGYLGPSPRANPPRCRPPGPCEGGLNGRTDTRNARYCRLDWGRSEGPGGGAVRLGPRAGPRGPARPSRTRGPLQCSRDDVGLQLRLPHLAEQGQSPLPLLALLARADPGAVAD